MEQSFLYCEICNIETRSEDQLRFHLLGQKHWYNKRQREVASRSVYVSKLPPSPTKEELSELFQKFGSIHKIILNTSPHGAYCIIEFTDVNSALSVLQCPHKLVLRDSTLKIKPREVKIKRSSSNKSNDQSNDMEDTEEMPLPELPKFNLQIKQEELETIQATKMLDEQIQMLSATQHILPASVDKYEQLLSFLQANLQGLYPNCRVLPFGSIVTGVATPTSDLDAVVLTEWTKEDELFLSSNNHYPAHYLKETLSPSHFYDDAQEDVSMDTTVGNSTASSSLLSTSISMTPPISTPPKFDIPPHVKVCGSRNDLREASEEYESVLNVIAHLSECTNILSLPNARCPIIHFIYQPYNISCDLSVNRRLGPYNSMLLKDYLNFDPRVLPLLHVLRAWARTTKIKRSLLNNYALSLMLIYSLQKTTPPVLPSIQSPGPWHRNMEWYKEKGFVHSESEGYNVMVDGWNLKYICPESLLISENTSTLGQLLCHFFHFYSSIFSFTDSVVAIHSPCGTHLSVQEAIDLVAQNAPENLLPKLRSFKVSPFCVQDPLELSHNVTKSFMYSTLSTLREALTKGYETMCELLSDTVDNETSDYGILKLFLSQSLPSPTGPPLTPVKKKLKTSFKLQFTIDKIGCLISKFPQFASLAGTLPLLDVTSTYVLSKLGLVVIQVLMIILQNELGFSCVPVKQHEPSFTPVAISSTPAESKFTNEEVSNNQEVCKRKRQRDDDDDDHHHHQLMMCDVQSAQSSTNDSVQLKKSKSESEDDCLLDLLEQCSIEVREVQCTVYSNTWSNRRQFRRHKEKTDAVQSDGCNVSRSPLLQFIISVTDPPTQRASCSSADDDNTSVWISLDALHDSMATEFANFFAFFKKLVLSIK